MKKICLAITGCLGRMGQQLIKSSKREKNFKLVAITENKIINKKVSSLIPQLNSEFAFKNADKVILFPIYTAGEKLKLGFSYINFAKEIIKNSKVNVFLVKNQFQLAKYIKQKFLLVYFVYYLCDFLALVYK